MTVYFSAIQPTCSAPHLGNYLGALRPCLQVEKKLRKNDLLLMCIADLHALSNSFREKKKFSPLEMSQMRMKTALSVASCGFNSENTILFFQSSVAEHGRLCNVLSNFINVGQMLNCHHWKFAGKDLSRSVGYLNYPLLMTADLILYMSNCTIVGNDQVNNINFVNRLISLLNHKLGGKFFRSLKKNIISSVKIKSLVNPDIKMSKSDPCALSRILMTDDPEKIFLKIKKAKTDSIKGISYDQIMRPGVSNLIEIDSQISDRTISQIVNDHKQKNTSLDEYKSCLANKIVEYLKNFRNNYQYYNTNSMNLETMFRSGKKLASSIAQKNFKKIENLLGLDNEFKF
ncbi:MAG: hypothetical protein MHPSP_001710 [Paramarteilia canceri]